MGAHRPAPFGWVGNHRRSGESPTSHFTLGESVRTPSVLLLEWKGKDWLQSQNLWRRLLVAYYLPRVNGEVMTPTVTHSPNFTLMFDDIAARRARIRWKCGRL